MANYPKGLFVKRNEKAPEFVVCNLSFSEKFIDWLKDNFNANGYCNVPVKRGDDGKIYAIKDEWKPQEHFVKNGDKIEVEEVEDINVDNLTF